MASRIICPFARGSKCDVSCMAHQDTAADDPNGITCLIVDGFAAVAKVGKLFDPEAASAMSGLARMIAPSAILNAGRRGLFRGKPKDKPS